MARPGNPGAAENLNDDFKEQLKRDREEFFHSGHPTRPASRPVFLSP
jgi:hypothetical protein